MSVNLVPAGKFTTRTGHTHTQGTLCCEAPSAHPPHHMWNGSSFGSPNSCCESTAESTCANAAASAQRKWQAEGRLRAPRLLSAMQISACPAQRCSRLWHASPADDMLPHPGHKPDLGNGKQTMYNLLSSTLEQLKARQGAPGCQSCR